MKNIKLYIPKIEDYWYEEKLQSDSETMSYNAGYDVSYYGYHYDTGCIDFPESKWEETYDCGLLIEYKYRGKGDAKESLKLLCENSKKNGVKALYDTFETNRDNTLKLFESVGFKIVEKKK